MAEKKSGNDLWQVPIGLRKTPQSFPPMPSSFFSSASHKTTVADNKDKTLMAKSALSVSFCSPSKNTEYKIQPNSAKMITSSFPAQRHRGLFSSMSLRLAASKIAEASPRFRRRNKSIGAEVEAKSSILKQSGLSTQIGFFIEIFSNTNKNFRRRFFKQNVDYFLATSTTQIFGIFLCLFSAVQKLSKIR